MLLQTSQQNLRNDTITVNGRPYRVDADGVVDFSFEEDAAKVLALGGWSDVIVRKTAAVVVEQGKFRGGPAFVELLGAGGVALEKAKKWSSWPGFSAHARGEGYLLSTEEAFRADVAKFVKSNRMAGEDIHRALPWMRPKDAAPVAKTPVATPVVDEGEGEGEGENDIDFVPSMKASKAELLEWATRYQIPNADTMTKEALVAALTAAMYPDT